VLLNKLPADKIQEHDIFPMMYQLGFIHSIPEYDFDFASAPITDVGFLGIFLRINLNF